MSGLIMTMEGARLGRHVVDLDFDNKKSDFIHPCAHDVDGYDTLSVEKKKMCSEVELINIAIIRGTVFVDPTTLDLPMELHCLARFGQKALIHRKLLGEFDNVEITNNMIEQVARNAYGAYHYLCELQDGSMPGIGYFCLSVVISTREILDAKRDGVPYVQEYNAVKTANGLFIFTHSIKGDERDNNFRDLCGRGNIETLISF